MITKKFLIKNRDVKSNKFKDLSDVMEVILGYCINLQLTNNIQSFTWKKEENNHYILFELEESAVSELKDIITYINLDMINFSLKYLVEEVK